MWMVLFITYIRMVQDKTLKNLLLRMALYHCRDLYTQMGENRPCLPAMVPIKAIICMWCTLLHLEYQMCRMLWAMEAGRTYDIRNCDCAICRPVPQDLFNLGQYWDLLARAGIPSCTCPVCQSQPPPTCPSQASPTTKEEPQPSTSHQAQAGPSNIQGEAGRSVIIIDDPDHRTINPENNSTVSASTSTPQTTTEKKDKPSKERPSRLKNLLKAPLTQRRPLPPLIPMGHGRPVVQPDRRQPTQRTVGSPEESYGAFQVQTSSDSLRMTFRRQEDPNTK